MSSEPAEKVKKVWSDTEEDHGFSNPMLERIRILLTQTEPEKWRVGGADLTPEARFPRPRTTYEQILVRDIPNGSLTLRCSQPVTSQYVPGGYKLTPLGPPNYTVEVRDQIFDADKVVDPRYADNQKGKRCDVIASGDIAKSLYLQVRETIRENRKDRKKTFDEKAKEISDTLIERIAETAIEEWQKISVVNKEEDHVSFTNELNGLQVIVKRTIKNWESSFKVTFSGDDKMEAQGASSGMARTAFQKLEEMEQNAQLVALNEVLKDLGFE